MSVVFTAFYADPDNGSRLDLYLPMIRAGARVLAKTNPGGRYVVLTDAETAPKLERHVEVAVTAPSGLPLMVKFTAAQAGFMAKHRGGIVVLAGTDCLANRSFEDAMGKGHGLAVTYKKDGKINNIGYSRDHALAEWFLRRALVELERMPPEKQAWFGDQESWEAALGPVIGKTAVRTARPSGRLIHLYPCITHNSAPKRDGSLKRAQESAFLLHFKGERKEHFQTYAERIAPE